MTADLWRELEAETAGVLAAGEVSWQQAERDGDGGFCRGPGPGFRRPQRPAGPHRQVRRREAWRGTVGSLPSPARRRGQERAVGHAPARLAQAKSALVLGHAAGASQRASSVDAMLRRWIDELGSGPRRSFAVLAEDAKDDDVEAAFASLLGRDGARRRVVSSIDALDQFERPRGHAYMTGCRGCGRTMRGLSPPRSRAGLQALLQRAGVEEVSLPPLDCRRSPRYHEPPSAIAITAASSRR